MQDNQSKIMHLGEEILKKNGVSIKGFPFFKRFLVRLHHGLEHEKRKI
jgi:hypothetical protein